MPKTPAQRLEPTTVAVRSWLPFALIMVSALVAYIPVYSAGFVWDDPDYVINNANLRTFAGLIETWTNPRSLPQFYPLVHTTFWIEYQLWQLWAPGYHFVNVLLHGLGAWLLYRLLLRLPLSGAVSLIGALLWSLHPVQVESVAWITERKNTLSAVFYFAGLLQLLRWNETRKFWPLGWAFVLYAAALASKTVTASLPAAYLLVLYWRHLTAMYELRRTLAAEAEKAVPQLWRVMLREVLPVVPFFAMGMVAGLFTAHLERSHVFAVGAEWAFSPGDRVLIAGRAVSFYLQKLAVPIDLAFIYPRWELDTSSVTQWLFPIGAAGGLVALWLLRHRKPWARHGLLAYAFFVGTLFPALGFFNIFPQRYSFVADHFQHLAAAGPLVLLGAVLARLPRAVPVMLLVLLGGMTLFQSRIYHDRLTLWTDTERKNPTSWMVQVNLGLTHDELATSARTPAARAHHENLAYLHMLRSAELGPTIPETHWNAGVAHANRGEFDRAEACFRRALEIDGAFVLAMNSWGKLELRRGQVAHARELLERALALQPKFAAARATYAEVLAVQGELEPAARQYAAALSLDPSKPAWRAAMARLVARVALAEADVEKRRAMMTAAIDHYSVALQQDPRNAQARFELAHLLQMTGRADLAGPLFTQALMQDPSLRQAESPFR